MTIAFIAAECAPLVKVGGLADVVGSLPRALAKLGHDVRIFIPNYAAIDVRRFPSRPSSITAQVVFAGTKNLIRVRESVLPDSTIPLYFIDWPDEFGGEVYPLGQDHHTLESLIIRFARFSVGVAQVLNVMPWKPEIVHCHDWHTALVPALLDERLAARTVLTVHNIDIQGKWAPAEVLTWLGVDQATHPWNIRDQSGNLNFLQLGIHAADQVTTVSPTYAREVLAPDYGEGLEGALRERGICGIVNGIDVDSYNPANDPALHTNFNPNSFAFGKAANKAALQAELGLPPMPTAPLFVNVGRLVPQKGINLLLPLLEKLVGIGGQIAFLGSGFPEIEQVLRQADTDYPGVVAKFGFDSSLGRRLYAAGDFFLMPSLFEPCGLGQLIAQRYGAIPIGRDTGGLHDTIIDLDADTFRGSGLLFADSTTVSAWSAIERAITLYHDRPRMTAAILRSMSIDHSWYNSAQTYAQLYQKIQSRPAANQAGDQDRLRSRSSGDHRPESGKKTPRLRL